MILRPFFSFFGGILLLLSVVLLALSFGSVPVPFPDMLMILTGRSALVNPAFALILWELRLPRVLAAVMSGGILAVGGVVCQGIFRNPLAEPSLLGISSGASLGAVVALIFFPLGLSFGLKVLGLFSFTAALLVTLLVFLFWASASFRLPSRMLLTGIAFSFLCQALLWFLLLLHRDQIERITFWTLGSLASVGWGDISWLVFVTLPLFLILLLTSRILDILSMGYNSAYSLGINPPYQAIFLLFLGALGTAAVVAVAGNIGFVGLIVPHVMRLWRGPSHRSLLLRSWWAGAILLVLSDLLARTVRAPGEIPLGIITALFGAPFLLFLAGTQGEQGRLDA